MAERDGWINLGQGRGSYEVVEHLVWVGEGKGDLDLEKQPPHREQTWKSYWQKVQSICCVVFYQTILVLTLVCLLAGTICFVPSVAGIISDVRGVSSLGATHGSGIRATGSLVSAESSNCSFARALSTWSVERRRWCCQHHQRGCLPGSPELSVANTSAVKPHDESRSGLKLRSSKTLYLPGKEGELRLSATTSHTSGPELQSPAKLLQTQEPARQAAPIGSSSRPSMVLGSVATSSGPTPSVVSGSTTPFDCDMGYSNAGRSWSVAKKFWCCEFGSRCPKAKLAAV